MEEAEDGLGSDRQGKAQGTQDKAHEGAQAAEADGEGSTLGKGDGTVSKTQV